MAAGAWTFPAGARTDIVDGTLDFDTNTFKIALFTSGSNVTSGGPYASATNEVASGSGYTTGGISMGALEVSESAGTVTVTETSASMQWTASGGSLVAYYAAIYKSAGPIVCYCLLDSTPASVTVTSGNTLTITMHASGIFTLA